jgi:pectinesterase
MSLKNFFCVSVLLFFFTLPASAYKTKITVAVDGSGDFTSIQEAIYSTKAFPDKPITIFIKNGTYKEKIKVPAFNTHLRMIGEDPKKTIITWDDYFKKINKGRNSTFYTYTLKVEADDFIAENITIENSAGPVGQAVALHVSGNRVVFRNCRILGNQDTLYSTGENSKQYYDHCYIEGTTDFIFGSATALFSECQINSLSNSYITAASTPPDKKFGFVFMHCLLTASDNVEKVFLGRPWRDFANVAFIECRLEDHILPEGWANWGGTSRDKTAVFREFNNSGPGAITEKRVAWSHQLPPRKASCFKMKNILSPNLLNPVEVETWTSKPDITD